MRPAVPGLFAAACALLLALAAATPLPAQHPGTGGSRPRREQAEPPPPDPYAGDDAEAKARAGIVRYGPFPFADRHGTSKIEEVLGDVPIRWVETAHFKIGSALGPYRIPVTDKKQRARLRAELAELAEILPGIDPKTQVIDPWLRLHLFVRRLEQQYADTCELLGVTDEDFPSGPGQLVAGRYMGEGPYLGMPNKFAVLLLEKESDLGRYTLRFIGRQRQTTTRHLFARDIESATLFLGVATEAFDGFYSDDTRLYCHVAFNTAHNLLHGYKFFWYGLPCWVAEGFAHWYSRQISVENNNWSGIVETSPGLRNEWNWVPKIYARVKQDYYPSAAELCTITDYQRLHFSDHMMIWSRIEYLLSQEDRARFAAFLDALEGRIEEAPPGTIPTAEMVLARQEEAFTRAYGMDWAEFDRRWRAWVLKEFKRRKR
ncbi:MAG: hypothetical protein D6702_03210 [Planctomycetota bacterium]|nr:MAG: hypothetical protein D6702_03210 [Planctomycetota bacterium]